MKEEYLIIGNLLIQKGDYASAIGFFNKAIELDPRNPDVYYQRGIARQHLGDKHGAAGDYDKAIELDPNYAEPYSNRGLLKHILGEYQSAIDDYRQALKIDPKRERTYQCMEEAYNDLDNLNKNKV